MTRGSVRLRLTGVFASLFLASGAGLLGITYGLVSNATNGIIVAKFSSGTPPDGSASVGSGAAGSKVGRSASGGSATEVPGPAVPGALPDPEQVQAQAMQYAADTRVRED